MVLAGTAIAVRMSVTFSACSASGVVTASQAGPTPCSKARQKTNPTGATRSTARYPSEAKRSAYLAIMSRHPPTERADREQHTERDQENDDRSCCGATRISTLEPTEDVHGYDFRLEGEIPRDEHDCAELADGARECKGDTG